MTHPHITKGCPCCSAPVRTQHLLCHDCWRLVPAIEQQAVQDTWRRFKHAGSEGRALINKRRLEYEQARQTAIGTAIAGRDVVEADHNLREESV